MTTKPSKATVEYVFTDHDWSIESQPEVVVDETRMSAVVRLVKWPNHYLLIEDKTVDGLVSQLEGWRDIFAKAAEFLKLGGDSNDQNRS